jgi:hypothetical protein
MERGMEAYKVLGSKNRNSPNVRDTVGLAQKLSTSKRRI